LDAVARRFVGISGKRIRRGLFPRVEERIRTIDEHPRIYNQNS